MGRASVLGTNQLTTGSVVNSQKSVAYDPLQTVVGRQGNQEQGTKLIVFWIRQVKKPKRVKSLSSLNPRGVSLLACAKTNAKPRKQRNFRYPNTRACLQAIVPDCDMSGNCPNKIRPNLFVSHIVIWIQPGIYCLWKKKTSRLGSLALVQFWLQPRSHLCTKVNFMIFFWFVCLFPSHVEDDSSQSVVD